jgi:hypothetical protein
MAPWVPYCTFCSKDANPEPDTEWRQKPIMAVYGVIATNFPDFTENPVRFESSSDLVCDYIDECILYADRFYGVDDLD